MKTRRHRERGSALAETAVVMTVLLMLMFGIIDFGRALYTYSFVAQLARQGARWAIVRGADCTLLPTPSGTCPAKSGTTDMTPYIQSLNEGATNASNISASLTWGTSPGCTGGNNPGCTAIVTVTYPFKFLLPFMPSGSLGTIQMSSTSTMVISN
jgi:Flp pilus assembly protein TadG